MSDTYELISSQTLSSSALSVTFSNIPSTFTDILVVVSARSNRASAEDGLGVKLNNLTSGYSYRLLSGNGSAASSGSTAFEQTWAGRIPGANVTSNTFGNAEIYIPNYRSSTAKSYSVTAAMENNDSTAFITLNAIVQSNTSAITSLEFSAINSTLASGSSFFLYGITRSDDNSPGTFGIQATGGDEVFIANGYKVHVFKSSGTFNVTSPGWADVLVIGGGGGGGGGLGGGGGAGGYRAVSTRLETNTSNSVIVGAGGAGGVFLGAAGANGTDSVLGSITSVGGGRGGAYQTVGSTGGSAGGNGGDLESTVPGTSAVGGQGNAGGRSRKGSGGENSNDPFATGAGGGASQVGADGTITGSGKGGDGISSSITGTSITRAGGGGGGGDIFRKPNSGGSGGAGGGGAGGSGASYTASGTSGSVNTGAGGGGAANQGNGGAGGSGIVIIRYPVS